MSNYAVYTIDQYGEKSLWYKTENAVENAKNNVEYNSWSANLDILNYLKERFDDEVKRYTDIGYMLESTWENIPDPNGVTQMMETNIRYYSEYLSKIHERILQAIYTIQFTPDEEKYNVSKKFMQEFVVDYGYHKFYYDYEEQ